MASEEQKDPIFERRRRAPMHHWARAENARFNSCILSAVPKRLAKKAKAKIGYGGTPQVAIGEAYAREAALALELITKAVIAQRIEIHGECGGVTSVPTIHDVPKLWQIAGLPPLKIPDRFRLLVAAEVLQWSGRYAAPKLDKQWEKHDRSWRALEAEEDGGVRKRLRFSSYPSFKWNPVNRLFKIADKVYHQLYQEYRPDE